MSLTAAGRYSRYRAPVGDGQKLCVPPWNEAGLLLAANRAAIQSHGGDILGNSLAELAQQARSEVLAAAASYTRSYANVQLPLGADLPLVLTGHQPGFVHPGVWLKNYAAAKLAQESGGVAVSLVIDGDLCRAASILVPSGSVQTPRGEHVSFDAAAPQVPWEERRLIDGDSWETFGTRVTQTIAPLVADPLVREWWPEVLAKGRVGGSLTAALSHARHRLELAWGSHSLEIPQSVVCQTGSFRQFAFSLLRAAEKFRMAHNESLAEYRREHRLRNHAQPVPNLMSDDGWVESPFWFWSTADPTRRAVFVKAQRDALLVSDRADFHETLPVSGDGDGREAVQRLADWEARGVKLRSRALVTTMFARLFLADVFLHGIGGAKYDQVTDAICDRLYGFRPPAHMTLTGTLRLPIPHVHDSPKNERRLVQTLRNLRYHPEQWLPSELLAPSDRQQVDQWVENKRAWVRTAKTLENAAERHRQIVAANEALAAWTAKERESLQQQLKECDERRRVNELLESREFAFCLFPHELLRIFLLDFSSRMP